MKAARNLKADIAVIGDSLGGVLAAWAACRAGRRVILTSSHTWLGGQMTAQAVPPDEHHAIERGGATASYRAFREAMRDVYLARADFCNQSRMTEGVNPGDGWVSRLGIEPKHAADYFEALLAPFVATGQLTVLRGARLRAATRMGRFIEQVAFDVDGENGAKRISVSASMFLDATETGDVIACAGLAYRLGKESHTEFGEPDAPALADTHDQQPVTWVMALRRHSSPQPHADAPPGYAEWAQHRLPHYPHALFSLAMPGATRGTSTTLPLFAEGSTLDWWRYRRIVAAHQWRNGADEVSLINWAQNDYALHPLVDGPLPPREVGARAKALSQCFLYWLQTAAPRHDTPNAYGYPELALATDMLGTTDGFAQAVYVRESRRIRAMTTLTQKDIGAMKGEVMPANRDDSAGVAWYNMDIHPTVVSGHGVNAHVRPFTLPLGSFVPIDCDNLLPACKNIGVTHLVNAATRVHPVEWLAGEVAGLFAAHAIAMGHRPQDVVEDVVRRRRLQEDLEQHGIPLRWDAASLNHVQVTP